VYDCPFIIISEETLIVVADNVLIVKPLTTPPSMLPTKFNFVLPPSPVLFKIYNDLSPDA